MTRLSLLAGVALLTIGSAQAQVADPIPCVDIGGVIYCDPASFHVTGPGAGSTKDPVIIQSATEFSVVKNSGGAAIDKPLTLIYAVPLGGAAPLMTGAFFNGSSTSDVFSPLTHLAGVFNSGDLYSFAGCFACDNSEQFTNLLAGLALAGLPTTTGFDVYTATVFERGFVNKDDAERVTGLFAAGTYIAPLAQNNDTGPQGQPRVTFFDAAFTETGLIDPPTTNTPEPMTLAMLGVGLLGLGFTRRRSD